MKSLEKAKQSFQQINQKKNNADNDNKMDNLKQNLASYVITSLTEKKNHIKKENQFNQNKNE